MSFYQMKAKGQSEADVYLYEEIGSSFFGDATSADQFAKDLRSLGKPSTLNLRINSPGGSVFDGMTIYNLLVQHPAKVITHIDGLAASIASVIAMAGDEIRIAEGGMIMVHNAWSSLSGYADDFRKTADILDTLSNNIADVYAKRRTIDRAKVKDLMDEETWMDSKQALELGFADSVTDDMKIAAKAFDPKQFGFKNIPAQLLQSIANRPRREKFESRFRELNNKQIQQRLRRIG